MTTLRGAICLVSILVLLPQPTAAALCKDPGALDQSASWKSPRDGVAYPCGDIESKCAGEGLDDELACGADIDSICCQDTGLGYECGNFQNVRCGVGAPPAAPAAPAPAGSASLTIQGRKCSTVERVHDNCVPTAGSPGFQPDGSVCDGLGTDREAYCSYDVGPTACARCADARAEPEEANMGAIGGGIAAGAAAVLLAVVVFCLKPCGKRVPAAGPTGAPQQNAIPMAAPVPAQASAPPCSECRGRAGGCAFCNGLPPVRQESSSNLCCVCLSQPVHVYTLTHGHTHMHIHAYAHMRERIRGGEKRAGARQGARESVRERARARGRGSASHRMARLPPACLFKWYACKIVHNQARA
jgi:hypothetical protein